MLTGAKMITNLDGAIVRGIPRRGPCVAVIPEGSYVIPYCDGGWPSDRPTRSEWLG